jgi:branched-chain amino acid transport system permease protein
MNEVMSAETVIVRRHTTSSVIALCLGVIIVVAIPTMPFWASAGHIRWVVELCCLIAIAQMWNLLAGYAGLVSVGQQAFIGCGGYGLFILSGNFEFNPFIAVPFAAILPALVSIPAYLLLRRLDGPYFAIGTWVVAEVLRLLASNIQYVNMGAGLSLRAMAQYSPLERQIGLTILSALLLLVTVGGTYLLLRTRHGLALTAMRDDAVAAASQGVNVGRLRFAVFIASAAGTGLAGAVYYMAQLRITPDSGFDPYWASICIFIVMVGGIGKIEGAIIGALLYFFATRLFGQYGATYLVVLGLLTLATALFAPGGIWGLFLRVGNLPWFPVSRILVAKGGSTSHSRSA